MKIIRIFEPYLFAFHFPDEQENELIKAFTNWDNHKEITDFLKEHETDWRKHGFDNLSQIRKEIKDNAEKFISLIVEFTNLNPPKLDQLFAPLINSEYKEVLLSKRKAKSSKRESFLRIYALKIDTNCYVITGGAIKFTQFMADRSHTQKELDKLEFCRSFLRQNGIVDEESFYDFLIEDNDE